MGIPIKITGHDYSYIIYSVVDNDNRSEGIHIPTCEELDKLYNLKCKEEERKVLAIFIAEIFLNEIESSDKYKRFVEQGNNGKKQNEEEFVFIDNKNFGNIVGVLHEKDWSGRKLKNLFNSTIKDDSNNDYALNKDDELSEEFIESIISKKYDITLQISSRFDDENTYFLPTMLLHKKDNIESNPDLFALENDEDLFEFLMLCVFKSRIKEAYINGLYRKYTRFENNDSRLKGTIDIPRHIKLNVGMNNGKIAYNYRENTVDNPLNHLILYVYQYTKKKYPEFAPRLFDDDYEFSKIIMEISSYTNTFGVDNVEKVIHKCRNTISHPFYFAYEQVRETCIKILNNIGLSMFDGVDDNVQGILFYIPDLWEDYLEDILNNSIDFNRMYVKSQSSQYVLEKKETWPDFVFGDKTDSNQKLFMVLDAKFKPGWVDYFINKNCEINDYTKCIRDMNTINAHSTGVIFPSKEEKIPNWDNYELYKENIVHVVSSSNTYDMFYKFPVPIPSTINKQYSEWLNELNGNMEITKRIVLECIELERERAIKRSTLKGYILEKMNDELSNEDKVIIESLL